MKMNAIHKLSILLGVTAAIAIAPVVPAVAATIGFEAPDYTVGSVPPAPWQTSGPVSVSNHAHTGSQALDTVEYGGSWWADDAMATLTFPEVDQGSVSVYVLPSTDIAGANFLNLAAVRLYDGFDRVAANAYFSLNDYDYTRGSPAAGAWGVDWWAGWSGTETATFQPFNWYKVTFSWDVVADQMTVGVLGAGVNGTATGSFAPSRPSKVELAGGGIIGGHATFDDLTVPATVPEPTGTLLFGTGLTLLVGWCKRRIR